MKYTVLIEEGPTSFGAYVPDLPGCAAVGDTHEEVFALIQDGVRYYLEELCETGQPIPEPSTTAYVVEVEMCELTAAISAGVAD